LATQVTDFDAAIGFFENRDDLRLGESTFFHSGVWSDPRNLSTLFIHCRAIGEVDTMPKFFHQKVIVVVSSRGLFRVSHRHELCSNQLLPHMCDSLYEIEGMMGPRFY
jgi:hypothetical protein